MKKNRILTMASVLIGLCLGFMVKIYIESPQGFVFMDHLAFICIIISMVLFIIGHLKFKKSMS